MLCLALIFKKKQKHFGLSSAANLIGNCRVKLTTFVLIDSQNVNKDNIVTLILVSL